jgi:predicted TIM-barrel fold metal-dependent hydrolase
MIIDAHTYIYDRICGVTQYGVARPLGYGLANFGANRLNRFLPPAFVDSNCPVETLLAYLDWLGIDKAVVLTQNVYGYANDYVAESVRRFPDRFVGVGSLDPLASNSSETLEFLLLSLGLKGINLDLGAHSGLLALRPDFRLDDQRVTTLWKFLEHQESTLVLDFGGSYGTSGHQLAELRLVLESCPDLKIVVSHLGFPPILGDEGWGTDHDWHDLLDLAIDFNVWFDTAIFWFSTALKGGAEEYPYPSLQEVFRRALDRIGPSKLMWGTDMPAVLCWSTYPQNLRWIEAEISALSQHEQDMILWKNALQVYDFGSYS